MIYMKKLGQMRVRVLVVVIDTDANCEYITALIVMLKATGLIREVLTSRLGYLLTVKAF